MKATQLCPIFCKPMDYTVLGILQARILEWIAVPISRGSSQPRERTQVSCIADRRFNLWASRPFKSRGQRVGTSALVLPMTVQSWLPSEFTGLISLWSKGLSRVFPSTIIQKHQFFGTQRSWRRKWQPTPVFLPGESHGQRSLVGYSPRGRKESDTTEWLHFTSLHSLEEFVRSGYPRFSS